jgi:branched-chain amino acid aminotransferase
MYYLIDLNDNLLPTLFIRRIFALKNLGMALTELILRVDKVGNSAVSKVDWENLAFGKVFTDHMLTMDYMDGSWQEPQIVPFQDIPMHPAMSSIHYGQAIFEGLKAYRHAEGRVSVFRPDMNAKRFNESAERMCMPQIPEDLFVELIRKLVELDQAWVSDLQGYSLYIRPYMFATDHWVGIKPSETYKFMILLSPVGTYYSELVRVKIEPYFTRAALGGVGRVKAAGNYGASLYPAKFAQDQGYHQLVWTDAKEHKFIEESGTMNILFVIDDVLMTPSEDEDTILRGVTKRSILELAQYWGIQVEERKISVEEVINAAKSGRLQDAFGAGTAATLAQIALIGCEGTDYHLPSIETRSISNRLKEYLSALKIGQADDIFNWNYFV